MATLAEVTAPGDIESVRQLFAEYGRAVAEPRCFAGFGRTARRVTRSHAGEARPYERIVLDSLPSMREALALYQQLSFRRTAPYLAQPTPDAICFEFRL